MAVARFIPVLVALVMCVARGVAQPRQLYSAATPEIVGASSTATAASKLSQEYTNILRVSMDRWKALYAMELAFQVTHNDLVTDVYLSPDYALMRRVDSVFVMSDNGCFKVHTREPKFGDRISSSISDSELAERPSAMVEYYLKSGYMQSGVFPLGGPLSDLREASSFLNNKSVNIVSKTNLADGLVKFVYEMSFPQPGKRPTLVHTGHFVVDPARQYIITEYANKSTMPDKKVENVVHTMDYYPPTASIPHPVVKRWHRVVTPIAPKAGKPLERTITYDNYRVERLPAEQLRLSYYNLPDEIVQTRTNFRPYYLTGGAVLLVTAGLYFLRRHRNRGRE